MNARITKTTYKRAIIILVIFAFATIFLLLNIFKLDFLNYEYYKNKTYNQITTTAPLTAQRGKIYDANMNTLAQSSTEWRIFVSPKDIKEAQKEQKIDYAKIISNGISQILDLSSDTIYKKITNTTKLDVTVKTSASEEEYKAVLDFVEKNSLEGLILFEATSSRYYPQNTKAAHLIGFVGSDNQGLYGLEYYYNKILSGTDGYYVYAKDANGGALDIGYSDYVPPVDGYSLVTTIDAYLQGEMESIIEYARIAHGVENRVVGVAMDTSTGAILAMATSSPFDPNSPFILDEQSEQKLLSSGFVNGTEEYKVYKNQLLQLMWSNKAVSETYEPGSTFKIVTVSAALDNGTTHLTDSFSCTGSCKVGGRTIHCHKRNGHGSGFNLAYGLQMSCNPCMIAISEKLGAENFYSYVKKFGYLEKTGIDLPGEASTIFHKPENIGSTELATASFGQRFKVTIINQLTAIAAVANGGNLLTPYVVDKIIDNNGKIIFEQETEIKRRVVSNQVADTVSRILIDGVSGDGGAKNAGVIGYDIAAKTGTSQKFDVLDENGNSYLRIGSTVAYATDSDSGIAVIIVVDEPTSEVKYGSTVAAPYVSLFLEKALPYLEYKSSKDINITIDNYIGKSIETVKEQLIKNKIAYEIVGNGHVVIAQTPSANDVFTSPISHVILYTTSTIDEMITVPNLVGLDISTAIKEALNAGLNIRFSSTPTPEHNTVIYQQSLPPASKTKRGSVVTLRIIATDFED